ncbi:MAG: hypothetical protein L0H23_07405 [Luteimonas sp.]|nr:hypothetical protein [Luteimonas sp.]
MLAGMDHDWFSPEWLDMSIAGMAISLDAFPTAPARIFPPRPACALLVSGSAPPATTAPRPLAQVPSQLLQISIVDASDELPAIHAGVSVDAAKAGRPSCTPPDATAPDPTTALASGGKRVEAGFRKGAGMDGLVLEGPLLAAESVERVERRPPETDV